ncbi:MAG: family 1 glycosylhydrolase, partial [Candidatus Omnitrophica bacterium]|nr:family 1 glycosylhydrolase [Candidatus Omnitrophota bacterium]
CLHYQCYQEDFDIAKSIGHNAHRLSIEWSRIQPEPDVFSEKELQHYRDVILYLRKLAIEPVVTLHHFTNPQWLAQKGGWKHGSARRYFLAYVRKVMETLADQVRFWVTINEPMVYVYYSFIAGRWPPQGTSVWQAKSAMDNLAVAHLKAYRLIHAHYRQKKLSRPSVSIAHNVVAFVPCKNTTRDRMFGALRHYAFNLRFLNVLARRRSLDFIGINYYTRHLIDTSRWSFGEAIGNSCTKGHDTLEKNSLGWEIYPRGLYYILVDMKRYRLPVYILENGICTDDDARRWVYIRRHLESVARAMQRGVDVRGYFYWSLIDNFEWDQGFAPRFGLCEVDYTTYQRIVRESARKFARVCSTGVLEG